MTTCNKTQNLLPAMADASLGSGETMQVVEHLRGCPQCSISWKRHLEIQHYFRDFEPKLSESHWAHQRNAIIDQIAWSGVRQSVPLAARRPWTWVAGAAAAAVVIVGALRWVTNTASTDDEHDTFAVASASPSPKATVSIAPTPTPTARPVEVGISDLQGSPSPTPLPSRDPELAVAPTSAPRPTPVPKTPEPSLDPQPAATANPQPTAEPAPSASPEPQPPPVPTMPLPGDPSYRDHIVEEQVAALNTPSDGELGMALLGVARRRLDEAREAFRVGRTEVAEELVASYVTVLGEGAIAALVRARSDAPTKKLAEAELNDQRTMIESMKESMGKTIEPALSTCKAAIGWRSNRATMRKGKHEILGAMQELAMVGAAKTFDHRILAAVDILDHRMQDLKAAGTRTEAAAIAYDAVVNRAIVTSLTAQRNASKDIAASRARVLGRLDAQIRELKALLKRAPGSTPLQQALAGAQTGYDAVKAISEPTASTPPVVSATPTPNPTPNPTPPPKPPPGRPSGRCEIWRLQQILGYHLFTLSEPTSSDGAELQRIYRNRFTERDRKRKEHVWKVIVESYLQRWIRPQDTVLDLGCGYGEFLNHVRCARRIGVDMNPDSPRHLERGIEYHACDLTHLSPIREGDVDVVFTSNALEHLASKDAVEAALRDVQRVLKPGGQLIAMGPNMRILGGQYWDFWDHHVPISDRALVELLTTLGYQVTMCYPRFLPYTTHSVLPKSPWLVWLYLRVPPAWFFLGGRFLIRALKT